MSCDKDTLVEFIMTRMSMNESIMKAVYNHFSRNEEYADSAELNRLLFEKEIDTECLNETPDVEYIISMTERYLQGIKETKDITDKIVMLSMVIIKLNRLNMKYNVMMADEDGLLLDEIDDLKKYLLKFVSETGINADDKEDIVSRLKANIKEYDIVANDYINHIQEAMGM